MQIVWNSGTVLKPNYETKGKYATLIKIRNCSWTKSSKLPARCI